MAGSLSSRRAEKSPSLNVEEIDGPPLGKANAIGHPDHETGNDRTRWDGDTPPYADIRDVVVRNSADNDAIEVRFEFAAPLPGRMPDEHTMMFIRFGALRCAKRDAMSFGIAGSDEGWTGAMSSPDEEFNASFAIEQDSLFLKIPKSELKGCSWLRWIASAEWASNPPAEGASPYSVDTFPNRSPGSLRIH